MWKLVIGFVLAVFAPLVLEHFMRSVPENIWRSLALLCVLSGLATIGDSSFVRPFWSDYRHHRYLSIILVMAVAAIVFGTAWCLFVLKLPNQNLTPEDAERLIPKWLDKSKMSFKKLTPPPDRYFWYAAYNFEGQPLNVSMHKTYGPYVIVESRLPTDDTTKGRIMRLSDKGVLIFFTELRAEILKQHLNCKFDIPLREIKVANQVSLKELNEELFLKALTDTTDQSVSVLLQSELILQRAEAIK